MPPDWPADLEGVRYPPPPWRLRGDVYGSVWLVPSRRLSAVMPSDVRPLSWLGRTLVVGLWARYGPDGVLSYDEVMVAIPVRLEDGAALHVPVIFVDHPASAAGGRALWHIPKRLATFATAASTDRFEADARVGGDVIAAMDFRPRLPVPGRWPVRARVAQPHRDRVTLARTRASARLVLGSARWRFSPAGPLAFLARHAPLASFQLSDATLIFGS